MGIPQQPLARALLRRLAPIFDASMGWLTLTVIRAMRLTDRRRAAGLWGWVLRRRRPPAAAPRAARARLLGRAHAPPRPLAAGASRRPRQPGRRVPGRAGGGDRADPQRRLGQS